MVILQDTREQSPLEFSNPYIEAIEVGKLDVGDYAARFKDGYSPPVCFERKSIGDLFSTLGVGYKRFKREIVRAQNSQVSLIIIIEGTLSKVLKGSQYSTLEGITVVRKLFTLWVRHGVQFVCCKDRMEMAEYITQFYIAAGKEYIRRSNNGKSK